MIHLARACFLIVLMLCAGTAASAQTDQLRADVNAQTERIALQAASVDAGLDDPGPAIRQLTSERSTSLALERDLEARVASLRQRLDWLGEPLAGESAAIARQRRDLSSELTLAESALSQTKRNITEIARIENEISLTQQASRVNRLMERTGSPVMPAQIMAALDEAGQVIPATTRDVKAWFGAGVEKNGLAVSLIVLAGAIALALALTVLFRGWVDTQIFKAIPDTAVSLNTGLLLGLMKIAIRTLPVLLGSFTVFHALSVLDLISGPSDLFARAVLLGVSGISLVDATARTFLTPRDVRLQIAKVNSRQGAFLRSLFTLIAVILFFDLVVFAQLKVYASTDNLQLQLKALTSLILCGLILALIRKSAWRAGVPADPGKPYAVNQSWLQFLRNAVRIGVIFLAVSVLLGYVTFSNFVLVRLCFAIATLGVIISFRALLKGFLTWLVFRMNSRGSAEENLSDDKEDPVRGSEPDREVLSLWLDLLVDAIVLVFAIPAFLMVMGVSWAELGLLGSRLLDGFTIGSQRFSMAQLLLGIFAFLFFMTVTRLVQRIADRRVFSRMRVDDGIRSSLKTLIGYIGLVLAFMTGVGLVGFDLSNLAIIAGALSVGIGFGLQSIVNNFVSGLILLFERPIKVGDWVVTASGEGIVKKISVRSTEIETFDRSSIIVPNSELISSSVTNWTHKNKLGRVTVPVGVSYSEDPERILEILRGIPDRVEEVLSFPAPLILFTGFGDSSLDFEIRAFIPDISGGLTARTKIRLAIFRAFQEAGVEIPFPQRDLHLRTIASNPASALSLPENSDK